MAERMRGADGARFKARHVWALWAFAAGLIAGALLANLF